MSKERNIVATFVYAIEVANNGFLVLDDQGNCNVLKDEEFAENIGKEIQDEMLSLMDGSEPGRPAFRIQIGFERVKSSLSCD